MGNAGGFNRGGKFCSVRKDGSDRKSSAISSSDEDGFAFVVVGAGGVALDAADAAVGILATVGEEILGGVFFVSVDGVVAFTGVAVDRSDNSTAGAAGGGGVARG